jgi:nitrate reductase gamma subunit
MTDHALFVVAPYVAALVFVLACVVRYVRSRLQADREITRYSGGESRLLIAITRAGVGVVALGHLVAFAFPDRVLLWDRQLLRLFALEAAGIVAGSVALAGLLAVHVRHVRAPDRPGAWPPIDVVAGTLLLMATMSGLSIAVRYRWASSWSEVTVVPYLQSLVRLDPSTTLVARLPFLVRLHVFGAFALLAIAPISGIVRFVTPPVGRLLQWTVVPAASVIRPACTATAAWGSTRVKNTCAALLRQDAEEN